MTPRHTPAPDPDATPIMVWWLDDSDGDESDESDESDDNNDSDDCDDSMRHNGDTGTRRDSDVTGATTAVTQPASGFLSRLSQRLVLTYTAHGDVVIDLSGDATLRQATERTGRTYLHVADRAAVADLDDRATPTSLIVIGRPSPPGQSLTSINDLFSACRLMMSAHVATLALIGPADADQHTAPHHRQTLRAAAASAGLRTVGAILALGQAGGGDRFLFYADDQAAAATLTNAAPTSVPAIRIDLFAATEDDSRLGRRRQWTTARPPCATPSDTTRQDTMRGDKTPTRRD